ncbi:T9SS type A sorting domain-containing protein, partial [bacterium]|nr:T9SS type A sorting domain-containing protein [bacterium]
DYSTGNGTITINLDDPAMSGDTLLVTTGFSGSFRSNPYFGGLIYEPDSDVLYTFGEPYETRYWLPCYDYPYDKVTTTMTVEMDEDYSVVSNGYLVSEEDLGDGIQRTVWQSDDPMSTYLVSLAISPYEEIDLGTAGENDTPMSVWAYPGNVGVAEYEFGRTGEMIELFEELFGPYPFNKYDQTMCPIFGGWGAMEHQTATTYGDNLVLVGNRAFEFIVAHELAHQWFGDEVGPFTFDNIWLNEGFASYSEVLWIESYSPALADVHLQTQKEAYFNHDQSRRHSLFNPPDDQLFSTTIYDKGSWVLHMIRYLLGDEDFLAAIQTYVQTYSMGTAATHELQAAFEDQSGMNLQWFFDQWVYEAGYPRYRFRDLVVTGNETDGYTASMEVLQHQSNAPYFSMPVPLEFVFTSGDTIIDVPLEAAASQMVEVTGLPHAPQVVNFDPEGWILATAFMQEMEVEHDRSLETPNAFHLSEAYPNPFNSSTRFSVQLPAPGTLRVSVFDLLGREVARLADGTYRTGTHAFHFDASGDLAGGTYIIRAEADGRREIRRVILLK